MDQRKLTYIFGQTLSEHCYHVATLNVRCAEALGPSNKLSMINFVLP